MTVGRPELTGVRPWVARGGMAVVCLAGMAWAAFAQPGQPASAKDDENFSLTNAVIRSVFVESQGRDPFCPVGYKKPVRTDGKTPVAPKELDIKLKITGIMGDVAVVDGGGELETGKVYQYREGKESVDYTVKRVTDNSVVIVCNGKEKTFMLKGHDLDQFIEKDGNNENKKP
ncbi:MAG: hypothetical protein PHV34_02595 [Verrucomicrobiae bacterium]|nr:hypothetical protein [Verrucomicrobiae bacterium]